MKKYLLIGLLIIIQISLSAQEFITVWNLGYIDIQNPATFFLNVNI